jgi:hypothetical protein
MEDEILGKIDLQRALDKLSERDRIMILLVFKLERPEDYTHAWPPNLADIGVYIGMKFHGKVLSESTIRYRKKEMEAMWRGERPPLRQNHLKIDLHKITTSEMQENPTTKTKNRRKAMEDEEYNILLAEYALSIRKIARKLGGSDDDLVEDLQQVGRITLWNLDLTRIESNRDSYIRQALKFRMIDFIRQTKVGKEESLDGRMLSGAGDQVTKDPQTGKIILVPRVNPYQWTPPKGPHWGWTDDDDLADS